MKPIVFIHPINELKQMIQEEQEKYHLNPHYIFKRIRLFLRSPSLYLRETEEKNKILICCHKKEYKQDSFEKIYDEINDENPIVLGNISLEEEIKIDIYDSTEIKDFEKVRLRILFN